MDAPELGWEVKGRAWLATILIAFVLPPAAQAQSGRAPSWNAARSAIWNLHRPMRVRPHSRMSRHTHHFGPKRLAGQNRSFESHQGSLRHGHGPWSRLDNHSWQGKQNSGCRYSHSHGIVECAASPPQINWLRR